MSPRSRFIVAGLLAATLGATLIALEVHPTASHPGVSSGVEQDQLNPNLASSTGSCGVERWSVKTGTDADAGLVNAGATTPTTIATMRSYAHPATLPANNRIQPQETTVYSIDATLIEYKLETDSDYHLVIQDASGNTMITEIPDPACAAGSLFIASIQSSRGEFDSMFNATGTFKTTSLRVRVRGVGFFDFLHGQTGVAPNGIELHPVLDILFNPPPPAATVYSVVPSSGPAAGGTSVTITGTNFTGVTAVAFGTAPAASFAFVSDSQITATSPAHLVSTVDVGVTTPNGTSSASISDQFTYSGLASYFPWYDLASPGMRADTIHLLNAGGTAANTTVTMPGARGINVALPAGQETYVSFGAGHIGGPVVVNSDQPVIATLRAWYYQSFNETPARPAAAAATTQYFPWYDLQSPGMRADTIHITNVSGSTATGTIALAGATTINFSVNSGQDSYFTFPGGTIGGPVTLTSSQPVLASLRAWYYQSFNEVAGRSSAAAASTQYFPWYDVSSPGVRADTIHITNESGMTATGTIALPDATPINFTVLSGADNYFAFPGGTIGGPVTITSNQPVLASLRAWYYQSFNEVQGRSASAAVLKQYFPWYDIASPGVRADTIHITNESGSTATGTIALGTASIPFSVLNGQDSYFAFPGGTIGGPVTITSNQPVLASLRAWYYQSFNEVPGYQ
jgi:IPT/TIG domain